MKRISLFIFPVLFVCLHSCQKVDPIPKEPIDPRDKFLGTWKATDSFTEANGTIVTQTYTFMVIKSDEEDMVALPGFANLGSPVLQAKIDGNKFQIPGSLVVINNMQGNVDATGDLINEKLNYQYSIVTPNINRTYTGTAVK